MLSISKFLLQKLSSRFEGIHAISNIDWPNDRRSLKIFFYVNSPSKILKRKIWDREIYPSADRVRKAPLWLLVDVPLWYQCMYLLTPFHGQDVLQGQFLIGLNLEFFLLDKFGIFLFLQALGNKVAQLFY